MMAQNQTNIVPFQPAVVAGLLTLVAVFASLSAIDATAGSASSLQSGGFPIPSILRSIYGETISTASGLPVSGVPVTLMGNGILEIQESDEDGLFAFTELPPGTYWIMAAGGYPRRVSVGGYEIFVTLHVRS